MRARTTRMAVAAGTLLLTACAQRTAYHWAGYDSTLYRHYKNPQDREAFVESLRTIILDAEQRGLRVPPGMYAEYGYALYEEGRPREAIAYFAREREQWPESRLLMDKMIRNAELRAGRMAAPPALTPASAQGPAGALERTR